MAVVLGLPDSDEPTAVFASRVLPPEAMGAVQAWLALDDWVAGERERVLATVYEEAETLRAEQMQALEDELEAAREQAAAAREAERALAAGWLQQQARTLAQALADAATQAFGEAVLDDADALAAFHERVLANVLPQLAGAGRVGIQVPPQAADAVYTALQQGGLEPHADIDIDLVPSLAPGVCVVHADGALFECDLPAWLAAVQAQWAADIWQAWAALAAATPDAAGDGTNDRGADAPGEDDLLADDPADDPFEDDDALLAPEAEPAWGAR